MSAEELKRWCVKLYGDEPAVEDQAFMPIFHEWIRNHSIPGLVLFDVADYAHVPDSPGVVLVAHEAHIALDRSDERFGLLVQRRVDVAGTGEAALADTVRIALAVADKLEADPRLAGKIRFDRSALRVEANDRLRAPNTDDGWKAIEPVVRRGAAAALGGAPAAVARVRNDPRDRLAADVRGTAGAGR